MGLDTPKQFLLLDGLPVMMHAIRAFHKSTSAPRIIVVIHPSLRDAWPALCEKHAFAVPHVVTDGGETRFQSVKNGLRKIQSTEADLAHCTIAVHDAARPLVAPALIDKVYAQAEQTGAAALASRSNDSVRLTSGNERKNNAFPRSRVYLMQTPQTFNGAVLCNAYEQPDDASLTDDASVVEKSGHPITLVDGDTRNIKITLPGDLRIAEILLRNQ